MTSDIDNSLQDGVHNCWVSFRHLEGMTSRTGFCLVAPAWSDNDSVSEVRLAKTGAIIGSFPQSGRFAKEAKVGVVLVSPEVDLNITHEFTHELADDVKLAQQLNFMVGDLLDCLYGGFWRLTPDCGWERVGTGADGGLETSRSDPPSLDYVILVGHGSAKKVRIGKVGALALQGELTRVSASEVIVLSCSGGCPDIGKELSSGGVTTIACQSAVDSRAAYIFGLNYIWKRFAEGSSPAQALGASNVVLPNDPFCIWSRGERM